MSQGSSRPSIGGQAVMEGVMMSASACYSVAVRMQDGTIQTKVFDHHRLGGDRKIWNLPIIRGVVRFIDSLIIGIQTLNYSADLYMQEPDKPRTAEQKKKEGTETAFSMIVAVILAVALFVYVPVAVSHAIYAAVHSGKYLLGILEGLIRMGIFLLYLYLISLVKDIRRTFEYHGAEHKSIHCFEAGLPLTVENVRRQTRFHKRCGTSFLFIIMLVSMLVFAFIQIENPVARFFLHLGLIPVIAGVSYEILKLSARSGSRFLNALVQPGLWIQHLTTREPDDAEIEVGIASVKSLLAQEYPQWLSAGDRISETPRFSDAESGAAEPVSP